MENRLKISLQKLGLKQEDLANKINMSLSSIKAMATSRKIITPEIAELIEKNTGISAVWLLLGRGDMLDKSTGNSSLELSNSQSYSRLEISCYSNVLIDEENGYKNDENTDLEIISLPYKYLNKNYKQGTVDAILVQDDSMQPTIKTNSLAIISRENTDVIDNKVYILKYEDQIKIRRIFKRKDGNILLRCDNENYPDDEVYLDNETVKILGQVEYGFLHLG